MRQWLLLKNKFMMKAVIESEGKIYGKIRIKSKMTFT